MADRQTIGKLRLPLPPTRKVNCHKALASGTMRTAGGLWGGVGIGIDVYSSKPIEWDRKDLEGL